MRLVYVQLPMCAMDGILDVTEEKHSYLGLRQGQIDDAERIFRAAVAPPKRPDTWTGRIDDVLLHPVAGIAILLTLLFVMFQAVFTWATPAMDLIEAVFVLETVADSRWHVDQFLAPTPVRTVIDLRGNDHTATRDATALAADFIDGTIQRFLARPGFNAALLKTLLATATERAVRNTTLIR